MDVEAGVESELIDVEAVSGYLSALTGGEFRLAEVRDYPIAKDKVKTFMYLDGGARLAAQAPYLHVVWIGTDESIHVETQRLGDTSDITEWMYGEKSIYDRVKMDLTGFEKESVREEYARKFPKVVRRLEIYRKYATRVSERLDVNLELLFHGTTGGLASFRLEFRFDAKGLSTRALLQELDRNIEALKQAYYEIAERQKDLYFIYALPANRKGTPEE